MDDIPKLWSIPKHEMGVNPKSANEGVIRGNERKMRQNEANTLFPFCFLISPDSVWMITSKNRLTYVSRCGKIVSMIRTGTTMDRLTELDIATIALEGLVAFGAGWLVTVWLIG